ncbi:hypothetical protein C5167_016424 [Papaver somniferum]|nr:hypothetical protein C5167_016424 [Papaver somniferum]
MSDVGDEPQEVTKGKRKNDTWTMEESNELLALLVDASLDLDGIKMIKSLQLPRKCGWISWRSGTATGKTSYGVGTETDAPIYGVEDKRKSALEDLSWNYDSGTFTPSSYETSTTEHNLVGDQNLEDHLEKTPQPKRSRTEISQGGNSPSIVPSKDQLLERLCVDVHNMSNNFDVIRVVMEKSGSLWDAMKEVPGLQNQTRFKAMNLIAEREIKDMFIAMSPKERYEWIKFQMKDDIID